MSCQQPTVFGPAIPTMTHPSNQAKKLMVKAAEPLCFPNLGHFCDTWKMSCFSRNLRLSEALVHVPFAPFLIFLPFPVIIETFLLLARHTDLSALIRRV